MNSVKKIVVCLLILYLITGCASTGKTSKKDIGTTSGVIIGTTIGALLGGDVWGSLLGAGIGAVLGGWVGSNIGEHLDEADRQALAQSTQNALASGQNQSWSNPESGIQGAVEVNQTVTEQKLIPIKVLRNQVTQLPPLEIIGMDYQVSQSTEIYGGPGLNYTISKKLVAGDRVHVVGKVKDQQWYMTSESNVATGFVPSNDLEPLAPESQAVMVANTPVPQGDVVEVKMSVPQTCRTVTQKITKKDGTILSEEVKACLGPNGWEII